MIPKILGADDWYGRWLPKDLSEHGYQIDQLINWTHWFMAVLFVGWGAFMLYMLVRFRARPGHRATHESVKGTLAKYIEFGILVVEIVLLVVFSMPYWAAFKDQFPTEADNPLEVRIYGKQFEWLFHYPGKDGKFGPTDPKWVEQPIPLGLVYYDENDEPVEASQDDIFSATFHFPVNRPVKAEILSWDVIHSFWIPLMRVKQDAIPGERIAIWFQAKETTPISDCPSCEGPSADAKDKCSQCKGAGVVGTIEVACAQLCGATHFEMRADVVIETESDFQKWLSAKEKEVEENQ